MGKINASRVLLGGLLAGVVINLSEWFWNGVVFMDEYNKAMAAINKPSVMSNAAMTIYLLWGFLIGILAVYVYAAIRPRFGAGAKTAVRAGLMMWALVYVQVTISFGPMGLFPAWLMWLGLPISLVEIVLATWLGARVYREESAA
jgi:hypothetical protein